MTDTKYAVVIVTHNREILLRECVEKVEGNPQFLTA